MATASSDWIFVNYRQTIHEYSATLPDEAPPSWDEATNGNYYDFSATNSGLSALPPGFTFNLRTPRGYFDRKADTVGVDSVSADIALKHGFVGQQFDISDVKGLVSTLEFNVASPPTPPGASGPQTWTVSLLDRVWEHDNDGRNSIVTVTESLQLDSIYVEAIVSNGTYLPIHNDDLARLFYAD